MLPVKSPFERLMYLATRLEYQLKKSKLTDNDCREVNTAMIYARDLKALVYYLPTLRFCIDWRIHMAAKDNGFNLIDYRLSDDELEAFDAWISRETPTPTEVLTALAEKNYKVSFTFVTSSNAWCISVTGQKDAKFNSGSTLTTWADEPLEGLYMAYFKLDEVFKFGVWKTKTQSRRG